MAALALSGDWTAEFLSGPDSASAPGLTTLGDAADADWTKEFIAEAAGSLSLLSIFYSHQSKFAFLFLHFMSFLLPTLFFLFFLSRSRTLGRGVSGAVRGEVVAGRPGRQGE